MLRLVKRANRQIRQTKEHFGIPNAAGLLLLANDGDFVMKPSVVMYLLANLLTPGRYTSIDAITYFAANQTMQMQATSESLVWIGGRFPGRREMPKDFKVRLRSAWFNEYSKLTGERIDEKALAPRAEIIDDMDFDNNPRSTRGKEE